MRVPRGLRIVVLSVAALFGAFVMVRLWLVVDFIRVRTEKTKSEDHMRSLLVSLAGSGRGRSEPWPPYKGKAFLLWLVAAGKIDRRDPRQLGLLFSPADRERSLEDAGGIDAYRDITLESLHLPDPARDRLTSFVGPQLAAGVPVVLEGSDGVPLIADLSFPDGVIIGFAGGKAKWFTREELGLEPSDRIVAGKDSKSPILRQLSSD